MTMSHFHLSFFVLLTSGLLLAGAHAAQADALFDFEGNTPNTPTPFIDTVNGLSVNFGGQASVCDSLGLFQSLSGHVLIQGFCGPATESGPLSLSFSANLKGIGFDFATSGGASSVTLAAFENTTAVGSVILTSAVLPGFFDGEGMAHFAGTFNRLTLTGNTLLAIDNVNAQTTAPVPEPGMLLLVSGPLALFVLGRRFRRA